MEEDTITPAERSSIAYLNKKRKLQAELPEMPLPKHVCWGQRLEHEFPPEPQKASSDCIFQRGDETVLESANISYSFPADADSSMSCHDDDKTSHSYPKTPASVESTTSSTCSDNTSSQRGLDSLESKSITTASSRKPESMSICEELRLLHHDYGFPPPDDSVDPLLEYGNHEDCGFSEYQFNGLEHFTNKDLENILCANGVDASNYILSSGRRIDSQEKTPKPTIDKEFEEYFSMLML